MDSTTPCAVVASCNLPVGHTGPHQFPAKPPRQVEAQQLGARPVLPLTEQLPQPDYTVIFSVERKWEFRLCIFHVPAASPDIAMQAVRSAYSDFTVRFIALYAGKHQNLLTGTEAPNSNSTTR